MRGIAAVCVVVFHVAAINSTFQPFGGGYLAVDFFFLLSGYVMARSYEGGEICKPSFLLKRVARLWPTMAIGVLLGVAAHWEEPRLLWFVVAGMFLMPLFLTDQAFPINNASWSIFFELLANAAHSLILSKLNSRALSMLIFMLLLGAVGIVYVFGGLKPGPYTQAFWLGLPRTMLSYSIGIFLFRKWRDAPPVSIPFVATIALLPVMLTKPFAASLAGGWFDIAFVILICPTLIAGGLRHTTSWGTWLGAISFPLYATHYPILTLAHLAGASPLVGFAATIVVAAMIQWWRPMLGYFKRTAYRRESPC
ncbi:hypothetical protein V474_20820 [Novosphingobium barchaimii LL02]|uniref:Acyltransferase 3 domain-containing protein n=1 Tax=Novosphingobium barchaimii LL02 TaxID=1114963 RepID=A0A0J7XF64_9SPHN|nr:hypothetical protein V474_12655 [Novosphingobium barchaimii LL02]KMS54422.1 hypothetical protein V474_20820 [Novosphingobium barchaimii LL02]